MPHITFENNKELNTPSFYDGVEFEFIARNENEEKISVKNKNRQFLLTRKKKKNQEIIKPDKITRVTPISIVKDALNAYAKASQAKILFTNINNKSNRITPKEEYLKDINYFVDEFDTHKEIWIEVGFGSGRHLIHQALQNPDILVIGLEIHTPSIEQVLKQIKLQNITNILTVNYDARLFLEFIKSNTVGKIFVHFPVPWDKKPHRRVYSKEFIEESLRVLKKGGSLELRSDSRKYFDYSLDLLTNMSTGHIEIDINKDLSISSKYEDRWKKMGKNIYDVKLYCENLDEERELDIDFGFRKKLDLKKAKENIKAKPVIKKDFVINFENLYEIDENSALIQVTFGSFNRPVSKFIHVKDGKASYYQGNPLPTSANLTAHKTIREFLEK